MAAHTPPDPSVEKPNRREFLYYLGGASLALLGMGSVGMLARFLNPPARGEADGIFAVDLKDLSVVSRRPVKFRDGNYWLAMLETDLLAFHGGCTFTIKRTLLENCPIQWVPTNNRFECPCCGSKYRLDGTYIEGPSQRGLDRLFVEVTMSDGIISTTNDGSPVSIQGATKIVVDTNRVIYGQPKRLAESSARTKADGG